MITKPTVFTQTPTMVARALYTVTTTMQTTNCVLQDSSSTPRLATVIGQEMSTVQWVSDRHSHTRNLKSMKRDSDQRKALLSIH